MTRKIVTLTTLAALSLTPAVAFAQTAPNPVSPPPAVTDPGAPSAPASKMPDSTMPAPGSTATTVPATPKFVAEQSADQWLGSDLVGTDVVTANDETLGEISDVVIDKQGSVAAAVIDVGGFLGIGAKPVAVSFDSLTMAPTEKGPKIVVALTKEELNQAPQFRTLEEVRSASVQPKTQ